LLTSISLASLEFAAGDFVIYGNESLTSISLASLPRVGEDLVIAHNASLTSISLASFEFAAGDFVITFNESLCQSLVDAFVEGMMALGWDNYAGIHNNDESC
jgi:hypothetical protein